MLTYVGGIIVNLQDGNGKTIEVTIKEGSTFEAKNDGDTVYLMVNGESAAQN